MAITLVQVDFRAVTVKAPAKVSKKKQRLWPRDVEKASPRRKGKKMIVESPNLATDLDVVDVDLLAAGASLVALGVTVLVELEGAVAVLAAAEGVRLVDLGVLGELSVGLEGASLVGGVLEAGFGKRKWSAWLW